MGQITISSSLAYVHWLIVLGRAGVPVDINVKHEKLLKL
jgi:hypothetical protein